MQDTSRSGSARPQPSVLLLCLSQLNTDTWAQVLLPKLVEQGSAAAVALTCSQLRDLCYNSRLSINLGALIDDHDSWSLRSLVQNLPLHFPNCVTVSVDLKSVVSYQNMPYLLPELARLSQMPGLTLKLVCEMPQPLACTMLYNMHLQLPSLRELTLTIRCPKDWLVAEDVHRELGGLTQLTRLCLTFTHYRVTIPLPYAAVQHLSSLKELQHLAIANTCEPQGRDDKVSHGVLPTQLLNALTALTKLESKLCYVDIPGLESVVNLQHLAVCTAQEQLAPADWASLAQLTRLTELRLLTADLRDASPDARATLGKLTGLQVVGASSWSETFLPALTACVGLTEIWGQWHSVESSVRPAHTLPQVLVLNGGIVPDDPLTWCERFPNARCMWNIVHVDGTQPLWGFALQPPQLRALCKHCTGLQRLVLTASCSSVDCCAAELDRVSAVQSMTSLQHLTRLDFTPDSNLEFLALVRVCSVLEGHSLQELHLTEGYDPEVTAGAWMHLAALRRLRKLSVVVVGKDSYDGLAKEAAAFLAALSGCGTVRLTLLGPTKPFETALAALQEASLQPLLVEVVSIWGYSG